MKRVEPRGRPSGPGAGLTFDGTPGGLLPVRSLVLVSSSRAYMATRGGNSKKTTNQVNAEVFRTHSEHFPSTFQNPIQTLSNRKKQSRRDDNNYTYQAEAVLVERHLEEKSIQ